MSYRAQTKDGGLIYRQSELKATANVSSRVPDVENMLAHEEQKTREARKLVWHRVQDSSHLGRFCFDPVKKTLRIQYQDGSIYQYADCSKQIYEGMLRADEGGESVGEYIARYLKNDRHPFSKVREAQPMVGNSHNTQVRLFPAKVKFERHVQ